jgi:uncharacterized phage-associated protein
VFKFRFDSKKGIEAAVILARQSPRRTISRKRLLALLYIANRECLKRSGRPMVGGRLLAMKHGPIHGDVYDLINKRGGVEVVAEWTEHFRNDRYFVVLRDDPVINILSRFEIGILNDVLERYEEEDDWDIANETHAFTEYKMSYRSRQARAIPLEQIIHAVGLTRKSESIMRDLKEKEEIDDLFAKAAQKTGRPKQPRHAKNRQQWTRK